VSGRRVRLIQVPYMAGDADQGGARGPLAIVRDGDAPELLRARGAAVTVERIDRGGPFRDSGSASAAVNRQLADAVRRAVIAGEVPLVLAGSCDAALGVLAGIDAPRCGVLWLDVHADFNTPESTVSGFLPGMALAVVTGHCYRTLWATIGSSGPVAEDATLLIGVRDLSPPEERERLERSAIRVVAWRAGEPAADVDAALKGLAGRAAELYVHVDLDALAPAVAPGVVDEPVPGGMTLDQVEAVLDVAASRFRLRAATVSTYDPERDREGSTLRAALRIVELLGAAAA
jgi:arginase